MCQTSWMTEIWNSVSVTFKLDIFLKSQSWEVCERALLNFGLPFETTDLSLEKSKPFLSKDIALSLNWWFRERHKKCHTNIFVNIETVPWHFFYLTKTPIKYQCNFDSLMLCLFQFHKSFYKCKILNRFKTHS